MNDVILAAAHSPLPAEAPHTHDCWEFLYCTGAACTISFDDRGFPCQAGDVVVIPPGTEHTHDSAASVQGFLLHIADATLAFRHPVLLQDDDNQSLLHLFGDALYQYQGSSDYRTALLQAYGQLIIQHISSRRAASPRSLLVEDLAQSIMQNYANPNYELDELLRSAPYCYDYLCRLFRQEMDVTPHKYLANLRLQSAADILRISTGRSITEIARMCGYNDPLYFSRMFKKKYGVSPREYSRQQE